MKHPTDLLPDYILADLTPEERARVEMHLGHCPACRAELREIQENVVELVESVPAASAPPGTWAKIEARLARAPTQELAPPQPVRRAWQSWLVAATLLVAATGFWWGVQQRQSYVHLREQQQQVADWLSHSDVAAHQLLNAQGERLGSVLTLPSGRALFVLHEPPPAGSNYQAWGQQGDTRVTLGASNSSVLEIPYSGFDIIGVDLEFSDGEAQPSRPLGHVPIS